ncbi:sec-independent translocase [Cryptosporangium arvum]|uniref:sec-independent translocase n=1 Tax=Cryptosporangium arvum TaxID=80871 RepID=UPI0004B83F9B|nr:sec-independent translocase [Cryptosporangium arvum]
MFENLGWWEIIVLALIGLFVFGPDRLPKVIGEAGRMLRTLRQMARGASAELRDELGTDFEIEDLHPKRFVRKHLLSEEDEAALRKPLKDAMRDFEELQHVDEVTEAYRDDGASKNGKVHPPSTPESRAARYDSDAT